MAVKSLNQRLTLFLLLPVALFLIFTGVAGYILARKILLDLDGKARNLFGVGTIPSTFILDKEGRIIGSAIGAREWDNKKSLALFQHLIDEETAPSP
jgi:hypothetical protein